MSTTAEQHAEHLDREQAEGDRLEELAATWAEVVGLPLDPPDSPEDEDTYPLDPERIAA